MYTQQLQEDFLFMMLYAGVTVMAIIACCYLLFRRGNAFAADVTPPVCLRRWTAAFFASMALSHMWYMPTMFLTSSDDIMTSSFVGGLLDCMTVLPLAIVILIAMLQDRRRPLWLVAVMVAPLVVGMAVCIVNRSDVFLPLIYGYFLLLAIGLIIYMVREVWLYGRWLRDNYADLEHKEVWQNFLALVSILFMFGIYVFGINGPVYEYIVQVNDVVLICYLLWRVETLSDLSTPLSQSLLEEEADTIGAWNDIEDSCPPQPPHDNIGLLLQRYCIDAQLYLQHDLTLPQLAKAIGINRSYLSQYFSSQGMTYNAYINDLRISYFVGHYREAVAAQRPFTAQQLACESGYRSYSTFSLAFRQRMGESVTAWIRNTVK